MQSVKTFLLSVSLFINTLAFGRQGKLVESIPSFYYLEEVVEEGDGKSFWVRSCQNMPSKAELQNDDLFTQTGLDCTRVARIAQIDLERFLKEMESELPGNGVPIVAAILGAGFLVGSLFVKSHDFLLWFSGVLSVFGSAYTWDKNGEKKISFQEFESQIEGRVVGRVEHEWALEIFTDFLNEYGVRP